MEYRSLGRTGVMISPIGLGSDNFGDATSAKDAENIINHSLEAGINLIDTGDVYCEGESERIIGKTIKDNGKRDQVVIATKVDHGRRRIGSTCLGRVVPVSIRHHRSQIRHRIAAPLSPDASSREHHCHRPSTPGSTGSTSAHPHCWNRSLHPDRTDTCQPVPSNAVAIGSWPFAPRRWGEGRTGPRAGRFGDACCKHPENPHRRRQNRPVSWLRREYRSSDLGLLLGPA